MDRRHTCARSAPGYRDCGFGRQGLRTGLGALLVFGLVGCAGGDGNTEPLPGGDQAAAVPAKGYLELETPAGTQQVAYELVGSDVVVDGDIIVGSVEDFELAQATQRPDGVIEKGAFVVLRSDATVLEASLWLGGVVRYSQASIYFNLPSALRQRVLDGIEIWEDATGLDFVDAPGRTPTGDYIAFFDIGDDEDARSSADLGRKGGMQKVNLRSSADLETIVHELGHAIGMYHEQNRSDRDQYVDVFGSQIKPVSSFRPPFQRWDQSADIGYDVPAWPACNLPAYNFMSVMHYPSDSDQIGDWPTMLKKAEATVNGPVKRIYRATGIGESEIVLGSSVSNANLGYGLFDSNNGTDFFYSNGTRWRYARQNGSWTNLASSSAVYRKDRTKTKLLLGDFDGNGRTDVMTESSGRWLVSWGGSSSWQELNADSRLNGTVKQPRDLATGDFNADEKTDILAESGGNWYVRWGGQGNWQLYADITSALPKPWEIGFGDFNRDHKTDIFRVSGGSWQLYVPNPFWPTWGTWETLRANAPGGPMSQTLSDGDWQHSVALGDFNGDGITDILYTRDTGIWYAPTYLPDGFTPTNSGSSFRITTSLTPLHFDNFNFNFVHTCKTVAGERRCHVGPDLDGDGVTDVISSQRAHLPTDKPLLSAGDIYSVCYVYQSWIGTSCLASCPADVP